MRRKNKSSSAVINLTKWLYTLSILLAVVAAIFFIIDSSYFPIKRVLISEKNNQVFKYIQKQELVAAHKEGIRGNIFQVNLNVVKARFEEIEWVYKADVNRILPDTIVVQLYEREPLAYWNDNELVDITGEVFHSDIMNIPLPHFYAPQLTNKEITQKYLEISQILSEQNLYVKNLYCDDRLSFQLELDNGIKVKLGRNDILDRARRFIDYWQDTIKPKEKEIEYVDMRYPNGFSLKWKEIARHEE